jgi:hypothetical protein
MTDRCTARILTLLCSCLVSVSSFAEEYFEKDGAAINPGAFTVVGDKLYLNYNGTVRALWVLDIQGHVKKADQNWPEIRKSTQIV